MLIDRGRITAQGPIEEILSRTDLPIAREADAGSVINTRILGQDEAYYLTRLGFDGGELAVGWIDQPIGSAIRIRIHAKDVSLSTDRPGQTSILNVLPAEIREMAVHGRGRLLVRLDLGGAPLLARITQKSRDRLKLAPGMSVYAQIKSVALTL
jgi:molybdate transport system ATP-binding protein